ncbi:hypothetical protein JNW90_33325 [Micromonospora sp. STR1s_5]|nr:hypothetical protein [Micromonospora sp. STR1s_5]
MAIFPEVSAEERSMSCACFPAGSAARRSLFRPSSAVRTNRISEARRATSSRFSRMLAEASVQRAAAMSSVGDVPAET